MQAKQVTRARLQSIENETSGKYYPNERPWTLQHLKCEFAFPCATQNEIDGEGASLLINNGLLGVFEGANLPTTLEGQQILRDNNILYIPGKASNAGGVGVSGFEMSQNAQHLQWKKEEVDKKLQDMMANIYEQMKTAAGNGTLEQGANCAGFLKVANAMRELGWVY